MHTNVSTTKLFADKQDKCLHWGSVGMEPGDLLWSNLSGNQHGMPTAEWNWAVHCHWESDRRCYQHCALWHGGTSEWLATSALSGLHFWAPDTITALAQVWRKVVMPNGLEWSWYQGSLWLNQTSRPKENSAPINSVHCTVAGEQAAIDPYLANYLVTYFI